jgi:LysM repeat protein
VALSAKQCLMCGASLTRLEQKRRTSIPTFVFATFLAGIILVGLAALLAYGFQRNEKTTSVLPSSTATVAVAATRTATSTPTATPTATSTPTPTATCTPTPTPTSTPTWTPTPTSTFTPTPSPSSTPTPTPIIYTVKRGDTLSSIAAMYGVTVEAIAEANGLSVSAILRIGQQLIIPSPGSTGMMLPEMTTVPEGGEISYVVRPGDSLYFIATLFGTTVEALMMANGITDPGLIHVNQELIIPLGLPTPIATLTPAPTYTPTPEPTSTPTAQPTFTPSATPQPTLQPLLSPTPAFPYLAPPLLAPADGQVFRGADEVIILNWVSVGILAEDEWYVLRLQYEGEGVGTPLTVWTKATSWRVPADLYPPAGVEFRRIRWSVGVMRQTHTGPDGVPEGIEISPVSAARAFYWYRKR